MPFPDPRALSASGGTPPYSYSWFKSDRYGITDLGTGSSQTTSNPVSFNIVCDVIGADGGFVGTGYVFVNVDGASGPLPY